MNNIYTYDESFINLCKSTQIKDIEKALNLCDEQYQRLNNLKNDKPQFAQLIVIQQKIINQIKLQLQQQHKNLSKKNAAQKKAQQLKA